MLTILHYIQSIDRKRGGTSTFITGLANDLGKITQLHVATHSSDEPVELVNAQLHYLPKWYHLFKLRKKWIELLDIVRPDIVHINECWVPACSLLQYLAQARGIKVIISPHGSLQPYIVKRNYYTRKLPALLVYQRRALRKADLIHVTASQERENFKKLRLNHKIVTIGIGVNIEEASIKSSYKKTGKILFLSRVHVSKGVPDLIQAFARLYSEQTQRQETLQCIIAGEGETEYIKEVRLMTQKLAVGKQVIFLGGIYGKQKWDLIREADVLVLPTFTENFGLIVPEALACGTPVIITKGAPWEDLEKYKCGWWTEIGASPIYEALKKAMSLTSEELQSMGTRGRQLVKEKYSCYTVAQAFLNTYQQMLEQ